MKRWWIFLFLWIFLLWGCGFKAPQAAVPDYVKIKTRLVALLPIDDRTNDPTAARMLREKMIEELYFKGYPKIPMDVLDAKLQNIYKGNLSKAGGDVPPKAIGELLGVDAVMYCTLTESKTSVILFYAPTSISVSCVLRSAKTGETLWQARHSVVERNFGFSRRALEMKASQVYEAAIQEVVKEIMKTLHDGPDLLG